MPWNGHCYHPLTKQIFEVLGFSSSLGVRGGGAREMVGGKQKGTQRYPGPNGQGPTQLRLEAFDFPASSPPFTFFSTLWMILSVQSKNC